MKYAMHCILTILLLLVAIFSQGQDASGFWKRAGYCRLAIDHMNGEGFALPGNVVELYVNPLVADARAVGTMYGVSAYPTFFLIDENGVIQETVVGYQKEFLDKLGKK